MMLSYLIENEGVEKATPYGVEWGRPMVDGVIKNIGKKTQKIRTNFIFHHCRDAITPNEIKVTKPKCN